MRALDAVNQKLRAAGMWAFAGGLRAPSAARVVRRRERETLLTDGPFAEGQAHIGGIYGIRAPDLGLVVIAPGTGTQSPREAGQPEDLQADGACELERTSQGAEPLPSPEGGKHLHHHRRGQLSAAAPLLVPVRGRVDRATSLSMLA